MANQVFCSSCGAGYGENSEYCPMCGIAVMRPPVTVFVRQHQAHCTGCGSKTGPRDSYCAVCGAECGEYIPQQGGYVKPTPGAGGGSRQVPGGFENIADGVRNIGPNLMQMKETSVLIPALIFALVSVVVGIIISFILDGWISNALRQTLLAPFVSSYDYRTFGMIDFKLGPITVWLLTCLGGLRGSAGASAFGMSADGGSVSIALGFVILAIVPIVSLIVGRVVRKVFVNSQYPGKELRAIDGLCAALMFAVVNLILSFFPSALGNALNQAASFESYGATLRYSVGTRFIPLFLFSFIVAFVMAMPSLKAIAAGSVGAKNKAVGLSSAAGASFIRLSLLCGLISVGVMLIYGLIRAGSANVNLLSMRGVPGSVIVTALLMLLVVIINCVIWFASFFTGGSLALRMSGTMIGGAGAVTFGALGMRMTEGFRSQGIASWPGGILMLIAGLWIAVTVVYKLLKNEQMDIATMIGVVVVPAVAMCIISSCASIGATVTAEGTRGTAMLSSASLGNFLLCAVFMALAVGAVFLAKRSPQFDSILSKLASTPLACAATAVATLVMCLTIKVSPYGGLDMIEDLLESIL